VFAILDIAVVIVPWGCKILSSLHSWNGSGGLEILEASTFRSPRIVLETRMAGIVNGQSLPEDLPESNFWRGSLCLCECSVQWVSRTTPFAPRRSSFPMMHRRGDSRLSKHLQREFATAQRPAHKALKECQSAVENAAKDEEKLRKRDGASSSQERSSRAKLPI